MKRNSIFNILYLFFLIVPSIYAKSYSDKGIYGSLGFSYLDEDVESSYSYSQQSFIQEYKLGYRGNIYSPRLLDYELEGLIRYEDYTRGGSSETTTKSDGQDYKVNLKFVKATKFPFRIYANKNKRPTRNIINNFANYYTYESENSAITGSLNLKPFTIRYSASDSSSITDSLNYLQKNEARRYQASLRHSGKSSDFQLNYMYMNEEIDKSNFATADITTNMINESVDMIYNLNISKDLKVNSTINYDIIDYMSIYSESSRANINLYWRPKSNYSGSLNLSGSRYDTEFAGNIKNRFDVFSISQNFNYNVTPTITITESALQYNYYGDTTEGINQNILLGITHRYINALSTESTFRMNSGLDGQYTVIENLNEDDTIDTSETFSRYTFYTNARIEEQFPSLDSRVNFGVNYYYSQVSSDEFTQKYGSSLSLSSNIMDIFSNSISASVSKSESELLLDDINASGDVFSKNSLTTININETVSFASSFGREGSIKFKVGVTYANTIYDDTYIRNNDRPTERIRPLASINFKYYLIRNLLLIANASANTDLVYENTNYFGSANISYKIGKTSISASYNYIERVYQAEDDNNNDYKRNDFKVNLVRTF